METRFRRSGRTTAEESSSSSSEYHYNFSSSGPFDSEAGLLGQRQNRRHNQRRLFSDNVTLLIIVGLLCGIFGFVKWIDNQLPTMLTESDIKDNPESFIGGRALKDLIVSTSVGPRICGSTENDRVTVDYLLNSLREIKTRRDPKYNMEYEVTQSSGAFNLKFLHEGFTSAYQNVTNIVAKLEPVQQTVQDSILLNCHFDSVPGSPGASDDMINCVTMLEILRILSNGPEPLRNTIVFLFNGAEENFLQGSHAFIEGKVSGSDEIGHRWKNNIRAVINMEACGAGGREILFQTGPGNGWLVRAYAESVPHPYGTSMGEEIFQRGLIPSDTDYRIFRDYLKVPGLDFAFIKNGWFYHTKYDSVDNIPHGSLQHVGDNILALTKKLGSLDFRSIEYSESKMVFTDIFGLFMIRYDENTGTILNIGVALVALGLIYMEDKNIKRMTKDVGITLLIWAFGLLVAALAGLILNIFKYPMPFFSYPNLIFPLFGIPAIVAQVLGYSFFLRGKEDRTWIAIKTSLSVVLLGISLFTRLAFVLTINVGFGIFGWYVSRVLVKNSEKRMLLYLILGEIIPVSLSFYFSILSSEVFVPIMGRSGTSSNPNLFLALFTSFTLTFPGLSGIIPILVFVKKSFLRLSSVVYLLLIGIVIFGIGRIPYGEKTPMRMHIVELERNVYENIGRSIQSTESGYWMFNLDPNVKQFYSEMKEELPELENTEEVYTRDCTQLYCGQPWLFPVTKLVTNTQWIPRSSRISGDQSSQVNMKIIQDEFISNSLRRLTFSFAGPSEQTIVLSPGPNYDLVKWSLGIEIPPSYVFWKERPTYYIKYGRGIDANRFELTLDFERKSGSSTGSGGPVVDINHSAFFFHGPEMKTPELTDFINRLPNWAYPTGWVSITNLYTIN